MRFHNFPLLDGIKKRVYAKGDDVVPWSELEAFAAQVKLRKDDLPQVLKDWADDNMMWIELQYSDNSERQISSVLFGASK